MGHQKVKLQNRVWFSTFLSSQWLSNSVIYHHGTSLSIQDVGAAMRTCSQHQDGLMPENSKFLGNSNAITYWSRSCLTR
jgi:hypothetical protein